MNWTGVPTNSGTVFEPSSGTWKISARPSVSLPMKETKQTKKRAVFLFQRTTISHMTVLLQRDSLSLTRGLFGETTFTDVQT